MGSYLQVALIVALSLPTTALADRASRHDAVRRLEHHAEGGHSDGRRAIRLSANRAVALSGSNVPSIAPGVGTYSGSVSVISVRGLGTYAGTDGTAPPARFVGPAPKARIIDIAAIEGGSHCAFEAGVCVIRPR